MAGRLDGAVVIVTGGTRGMGEAVVRGIVAQGGKAVFGGRDEEAGNQIAAELTPDAVYVRHDVTSRADWDRIVAVTLERFGAVTGLVNNAGFGMSRPVAEMTDEEWQSVIAVNQTGVFLGMQVALKPMCAAGGGSIVNISSPAAVKAHPGLVAYSAAKAAVIAMTRVAAVELAAEGVRVNAVIPGFFATRLLDESSYDGKGRERATRVVPMRRVAMPDEIVGTVVHLLSADSGYVTGTQIAVDGGYTA